MANEQNLIKFTSEQNREEASKNGKKGGVASGAARRQKGAARRFLKEILAYKPEMTVALAKSLKGIGGNPEDGSFTTEKLMMVAMIQKGMKGDTQATKLVLEMLGEDAKTIMEEKRLKVQKEAVEAIRNSDGFMDAMAGIAEEVFTDGGDTPDTIEDSE